MYTSPYQATDAYIVTAEMSAPSNGQNALFLIRFTCSSDITKQTVFLSSPLQFRN